MLLDNARVGDLVIFSDGSQTIIQDKTITTSGDVYVTFDKKVTGWIDGTKYRSWAYHRDGRFVLSGNNDGPHVDIIKVIHNDQDIR